MPLFKKSTGESLSSGVIFVRKTTVFIKEHVGSSSLKGRSSWLARVTLEGAGRLTYDRDPVESDIEKPLSVSR